jgi:hypothetical protein
MNPAAEVSAAPATAWQPLTFAGVAAFAEARLGRLLAAELLVAVVLSGVVVWFLHRGYSPVVLQAIEKMPDTARIVRGQLQGVRGAVLSESKFLAIAVTPEAEREIGQGADLQVQLRQTDFCIGSVFRPDWGLEFEYGAGTSVELSRKRLEPWWEAWQPVCWTTVGLALVIVVLAAWWLVAALYTPAAMFIAWFSDRRLSWKGTWQISSAALMPGALLMAAALFSYGWRAIDLLGLSIFFVAHFIMAWVYVAGGVCAAPRLSCAAAKRNPFSA